MSNDIAMCRSVYPRRGLLLPCLAPVIDAINCCLCYKLSHQAIYIYIYAHIYSYIYSLYSFHAVSQAVDARHYIEHRMFIIESVPCYRVIPLLGVSLAQAKPNSVIPILKSSEFVL